MVQLTLDYPGRGEDPPATTSAQLEETGWRWATSTRNRDDDVDRSVRSRRGDN
jgi:hypothetical protein